MDRKESGGYNPQGHKWVEHDWATKQHLCSQENKEIDPYKTIRCPVGSGVVQRLDLLLWNQSDLVSNPSSSIYKLCGFR